MRGATTACSRPRQVSLALPAATTFCAQLRVRFPRQPDEDDARVEGGDDGDRRRVAGSAAAAAVVDDGPERHPAAAGQRAGNGLCRPDESPRRAGPILAETSKPLSAARKVAEVEREDRCHRERRRRTPRPSRRRSGCRGGAARAGNGVEGAPAQVHRGRRRADGAGRVCEQRRERLAACTPASPCGTALTNSAAPSAVRKIERPDIGPDYGADAAPGKGLTDSSRAR